MDEDVVVRCAQLLRLLSEHQYAWPFSVPVDPIALNLPDYLLVVREPMDLGTIRSRLAQGHYQMVAEFLRDLGLVWYNCKLYNRPGSDLAAMADVMQQEAAKLARDLWLTDENDPKAATTTE